jgi:hypothetical protein
MEQPALSILEGVIAFSHAQLQLLITDTIIIPHSKKCVWVTLFSCYTDKKHLEKNVWVVLILSFSVIAP